MVSWRHASTAVAEFGHAAKADLRHNAQYADMGMSVIGPFDYQPIALRTVLKRRFARSAAARWIWRCRQEGKKVFQCFNCDRPDPLKDHTADGYRHACSRRRIGGLPDSLFCPILAEVDFTEFRRAFHRAAPKDIDGILS